MTHCRTCSRSVAQGDRFCPSCGSSVVADADAPTIVTKPASPPNGRAARTPPSGSEGLAEPRFLPGTILAGRYRVVGLLGRGGMGEVCRADDLKLSQPVALKFMPEELERDGERLGLLLNEVRIARQISHPNVCRVYDVGEVDGHQFISMEYVDGEDLASLLRRIGRLPQDKAIQIARQLCAGLAAAHARGILHRDLKPSNVMIDGRGHVRITDFGLAGLAEEIKGRDVRSGTPDYMAPEQLAGRDVSVRSDIYALGHVLYELFTGKRAFRADSLVELARLQREATPTSPSAHVRGLDPVVEQVILRCLEKDPAVRPASALAVAAALPGGSPLEAALAAGETPSPEMVAAAGPHGGVRPALAVMCLAIVVAAVPLLALLHERTTLYGIVPVERPIMALAVDAREIIRSFGYTDPPTDRAWEVAEYPPALQYLAETDAGPRRWEPLARPGQLGLFFRYRQSPHPLAPQTIGGQVTFEQPPPREGDIRLTLDLEGRLLHFVAEPPPVSHAVEPERSVDWSVLFGAARLDIADFEPTEPTIQPPVFADVRRAWKGTLPHLGDLPARVEAATLHGRPVFFQTVTPCDPTWSEQTRLAREATPFDEAAQMSGLGVLLAILAGAIFLAHRNWRLDRGDRKGALRLVGYLLALRMAHWAVTGHHVTDLGEEIGSMIVVLGGALLIAALTWLLYLALEPYARKLWPEALVSWSRLLAGRLRDPLVGRDLLFGFAIAVGVIALESLPVLVAPALGLPPPAPKSWGIAALAGGRWAFGELFAVQLVSLSAPFVNVLLFLLLRILLRKPWLAAIAFCAIGSVFSAFGYLEIGGAASPGLMALGCIEGAITSVLLLVVIMRFGVVSTVAFYLMANLVASYPITLDASAPFFATSLLAMLVILGLAVYAFHVSLGGQRVFADAIFREQPLRRPSA
jgi:serine/threonine-protein kinase